ncbi:hypothetical protein ABIA33_001379 [Streptacidiphilus sp. MAP12-16]|uniref:hypothetical protein n=1 Tax=Streptacidiphilus sp. MAP12-16 TaxID=3156300 RepID=UPI0035196E62
MTSRHRWQVAWLLALTAVVLVFGAVTGGRALAAPPPQPAPGAGLAPSAGTTLPSDPMDGAPKVPTPSPGPAPDPHYKPPSPTPRPAPPPDGGLMPPANPPDPNATGIFDIPGQIKAAMTSLLASLLQPLVVPLMNMLAHFLLTTPEVTAQPRVAHLWDSLRILACSLYGLFVLATGILAMSHGTVQQRWAPRDLIPRLALGMFAANLSLFVCRQAITLTNAVSVAIFGNGITAQDLAGTMVGLMTNSNPDTAPLYMLVFLGAVLGTGVVLLVTLLVRTAVVIVLVVAAPLMLACHGFPATEGAARMWWRAFTGVLTTQIIQSIVFLVCVKVVLDPSNYNMFGLPTFTSMINLMLLCCTFYLLIKIPGWIRTLVTQPVHRSMGAGRGGGMHLLKKVALGAIGLPLGPYALGAQLAGRAGMRAGAGRFARAAAGGRPPRGGARPGGRGPGPGPGNRPPGGPRPGNPAGGPGVPHYQWGQPAGRGQGPAQTPGNGPAPGNGPTPPGATGPGPGAPRPPGPGGGPAPQRPGGPASAQYVWGRPRPRGAANHVPAAGPIRPQLPGGRSGTAQPGSGPPHPGGAPLRPTPPNPRSRPTAPPPLRPARAALPPPLPRPAPLRPPLDDGPAPDRRGRRP